jgi:hypothetical protein
MPYAYVDWSDISTDELVEELERRSEDTHVIMEDEVKTLIERIWMCRKLGVSDDEYVNELVYKVLGRVL